MISRVIGYGLMPSKALIVTRAFGSICLLMLKPQDLLASPLLLKSTLIRMHLAFDLSGA